jgi:hypothetical protein
MSFYSDNLGEEVSRGMKERVSREFYIARKPPKATRKKGQGWRPGKNQTWIEIPSKLL